VVNQASREEAKGLSAKEIIDREACMGSGNCSYWAPGVFELDDEGIAVVCGDLSGHEDEVRLAAKHCPTRAIRVDDFYVSLRP
jgi:ferredoxin